MAWLAYGVLGIVLLAALDRILLRLESAGRINYRRKGVSKGAAAYHSLELQSIFEPGAEHVMEVRYGEEEQEDEQGDSRGNTA